MARRFCKHYEGMFENDRCKAGVVFAELEHHGTKEFRDSCPCFSSNGTGNCEFKTYPTAEEMAEEDRKNVELFKNITKARAAIIEECGDDWVKGRSSAGRIDCPVCGGSEELQYSRSGYNGHIRARCETDGCVAWME